MYAIRSYYEVSRDSRLRFDDDWVLDDPNEPPGVWWVPEGERLGFRVLRPADDRRDAVVVGRLVSPDGDLVGGQVERNNFV